MLDQGIPSQMAIRMTTLKMAVNDWLALTCESTICTYKSVIGPFHPPSITINPPI